MTDPVYHHDRYKLYHWPAPTCIGLRSAGLRSATHGRYICHGVAIIIHVLIRVVRRSPFISSRSTIDGVRLLAGSTMRVITQYLVAAFVECTLYGIFLLLSSFALILLYRRHRMACKSLSTESRLPLFRRCIAQIWMLRKAPLIAATVLLMVSVTAVSTVMYHL